MPNQNAKPVAVITGGSRGIGAACCRALAEKGFRVGIHGKTINESTAPLPIVSADKRFVVSADLTDTGQVDAMVERIRQKTGRVDVLVNNAGMTVNKTISAMKMDEFDAQRALLRGTWYLTKRILRCFMLRQSTGRIINISSVTGYTGNPGQIPYTMEKAALDAMTRSLARELAGRNILVNSVAPGFIKTDMTETLPESVKAGILANTSLGRMGEPGEVAEVVAFLATGGSYINGSVIHVNGGLYGG